jgi:hypothetical protein
MPDYQPVNNNDTNPFTLLAGATIVGGTLVAVSAAGTVITAVAGTRPIGVAAHDAVSGMKLSIWPMPGLIHETTVEGVLTVTFGNDIICGATGFIKAGTLATDAAAGTLIGIATSTGTGGSGSGKARWIGV